MTDSAKSNNGGSRLLGKLLLPGFAEAGASTSFQPSSPAVGPASDAATEIRDNRSLVKQQFRMNASRNHPTAAARQESSDSSTASSALIPPSQVASQDARKVAFFPSTKPQKSPRPVSPPEVTREQIPVATASVAGTSMVPEIGTFPFSKADSSRSAASSVEKENQKRIYYWQSEENLSSSSKKNMTLNEANLRRAENALTRNKQSQTDSSSAPGPNRNSSLLHDDETGSDAMSTASEMGTVIEIGNRAARMAEIDAMAALIEASPNVDTLTPRSSDFPQPPSQTPNRRGTTDTIADLAMPTLDSQSRPVRALAPQTRALDGMALTLDTDQFQEQAYTAPPATSIPTPTEMLTSALRRLGTGLSKKKVSLSAPPTPSSPEVPSTPRVEDLLRSSLTPERGNRRDPDSLVLDTGDLPASLVLRSPGSSARFSLSRLRRDTESAPVLAPRFSPHHDTSRTLENGTSYDSTAYQRAPMAKSLPSSVPTLSTPLRLNPVSPFRLAQQCLSYDSTLDELQEVDSATGSASSSHVLNLESYPMRQRTEYQPKTGKIHESMSWDVSSTSTAFRSEPHRSYRIGGLKATDSQIERNAQRLRIHSDFSPHRGTPGAGATEPAEQRNVLKLRTPERFNIDVEREDALDILACLVERGVAAWNEEPVASRSPNDSTESVSQTREALVSAVVEDLRKIADENSEGAAGETAAEQVDALEELLKAHSYALEMKRASLSASSWLKSIGRGPLSNERYLPSNSGPRISQEQSSRVGEASGEDATSDKPSESSVSLSVALADAKLEMLTLTARLHSAENELKEKTVMNQRLDEELSKCRAEIGRLRTVATKNENKSMIDDDADTVETGPSPEDREAREEQASTGAPNGIIDEESKLFDESFQGNNSLFQDVSTCILQGELVGVKQPQENLDLLVLKTALDQANDTIRLLHEKLHHETPEEERDEAPVVDLPSGKATNEAEGKSPEKEESVDCGEERQTINVRMLNGENFVTEWVNLSAPLPPPPDHGLRSPIIDAVLEQWTDDRGLHDSLLTWMERVMTGENLEDTLPPLTISSLDHQVRDGFVMHLLPLLLRRADIHVNVKTRAHRMTTYDLAVSVTQTRNATERQVGIQSPSLLDQHNSDEQDQPETSQHAAGPFGREEDSEYTHFRAASEDMDDGAQTTFMGALGGALGGLLSRGRHTLAQSPARSQTSTAAPAFQQGAHLVMPAASTGISQGPSGTGSRVELDSQPYHRVVSAPPGRIGITFVEYRGHAMVADMAADSPLSSWIFPSDILIAVDEVPVSGMRIRDIIKILTNRKDRQRALRVISSHAMNEFTLNQSASVDEAP